MALQHFYRAIPNQLTWLILMKSLFCKLLEKTGLLSHRPFFRRVSRMPRRIVYEADRKIRITVMGVANKFGRQPIVDPAGPVVSLTTYGTRARTVHLAIESIGRGEMRPSRIVLWLDDQSLCDNLPNGVRRLQRRGLEVKRSHNYGPYKKSYPYVESLEEFEVPLVTADDDVLYPRHWLKELVKAFREFPDAVNCWTARTISLDDRGGLSSYESWKLTNSTSPSYRHVAIGVGGVIYPPPLQRALKQQGTAFLEYCPTADDVWLHLLALRAGYKVRKISEITLRQPYIPGTQGTALLQHNVFRKGNDLQIAATYQESDIDRLREYE